MIGGGSSCSKLQKYSPHALTSTFTIAVPLLNAFPGEAVATPRKISFAVYRKLDWR